MATRSVRSYSRVFLNLTVFLVLQSQLSAHSKPVLDDSLITVDTTPLDQHKLCYINVAPSIVAFVKSMMT